jgi:two-component sensor histidine kinase
VPPANSKPLSVLAWSIVLTAILAAAMAAATVWLVVRMQREEQWLRQALTARNQMAQVLILVQRMETSQRGYLLTGRDVYLGRYEDAEAALPTVIDEVAKLVADNPAQQQTIARLRQIITEKLRELRSTIDEQRAGHTDAARAIVNSDRGLRMMDQIRQLFSEMVSEQDRLLSIHASTSEAFGKLLQIGAVTAFVLICGVSALVGVYVRRSFVVEHLLMREGNHRAKNVLSVVEAIAHQTATKGPEDFIERFSERLRALSANHDLLVRNEWHGVEIEDLVRAQLAPFADLIGYRIVVCGPSLRLNAACAQTIGLALHELATNAGKYGALSTDTGRIDICWGCDGDTFNTSWTEREGPPVSAPQRRGFGTIVMEAMMRRSLDGVVDLDYAPLGVTWRLTCPPANALEPLGTRASGARGYWLWLWR